MEPPPHSPSGARALGGEDASKGGAQAGGAPFLTEHDGAEAPGHALGQVVNVELHRVQHRGRVHDMGGGSSRRRGDRPTPRGLPCPGRWRRGARPGGRGGSSAPAAPGSRPQALLQPTDRERRDGGSRERERCPLHACADPTRRPGAACHCASYERAGPGAERGCSMGAGPPRKMSQGFGFLLLAKTRGSCLFPRQ